MSRFLSIRNYMHFRHLFDAVHPFFWPVLYWQLKCAWLSLQREKRTSVLIAVTWWGGVRIVHRGDRIETPEANPFALTKPRYDNPVWFTDVPAEFLSEATCTPLILPCLGGGGGCPQRGPSEGACALTPNTS